MINIIIVDDHQVFLDALKVLLEDDPDINLLGTAEGSEKGMALVKSHKVDVAVLDHRLKGSQMNGLDMAELIYHEYPQTQVLMLSMSEEGRHIARALKQRVAGFIGKSAAAAELKRAIRDIHAGKTYYSTEVMKAHMDYTRSQHQSNVKLTKRVQQILKLLVEEYSTSEIGNLLNIGEAGVETHRRNLRAKLNVKNTAGLVREALVRGLVEVDIT